MSEKSVNQAETRAGTVGSHRRLNRRSVIIVVIVVCVLTASVIATSVTVIPTKLTISITNHTRQVLIYHVYVDDVHHSWHFFLEPGESASHSWSLTGWLHKYDIAGGFSGILINFMITWTHVIILPFTEKTISH